MTLPEHCYPIVREFREAFRINQVNPVTHRQLWEEESHEYYIAKTREDEADALGDMVFIHCGSMLDTGNPPAYMSDDHFWRYIAHEASVSGINLKRAVELIFDSNMSKLVAMNEMADSINKYESIGVSVRVCPTNKNGFYSLVVNGDCAGTDGKFYPKDKVLKGTGFFEPKWSTDDSWVIK